MTNEIPPSSGMGPTERALDYLAKEKVSLEFELSRINEAIRVLDGHSPQIVENENPLKAWAKKALMYECTGAGQHKPCGKSFHDKQALGGHLAGTIKGLNQRIAVRDGSFMQGSKTYKYRPELGDRILQCISIGRTARVDMKNRLVREFSVSQSTSYAHIRHLEFTGKIAGKGRWLEPLRNRDAPPAIDPSLRAFQQETYTLSKKD